VTETASITDLTDYLPGLRAFTTPRGIRVIELDWWADPAHDSAWAAAQRKLYSSEREWRREMGRDWSTPSGDPFYPEFVDLGPSRFIFPMQRLIQVRDGEGEKRSVVYRSYDFGRRTPACTWFQYSPKSDRVWWIREFMPRELQANAFRDAVRYLSNEFDYDKLTDPAKRWVDTYAAKPSGSHCPPPWFPKGTEFIDVSGKEANQGGAQAVLPELANTRNIFAEVGMHLVIVNPRVKARCDVVRRLLRIYPDGHPGLFIDPQCEEGIEMFSGKLHYPKSTPTNPVPTKPAKNVFVNMNDALGYGIVAVVPAEAPAPPKEPVLLGYRKDGRTPIYSTDQEEVGWNETRLR
jgi:hypothetical protein